MPCDPDEDRRHGCTRRTRPHPIAGRPESHSLAQSVLAEERKKQGDLGEDTHQYWPAAIRPSIHAGAFDEARAILADFRDPGLGAASLLLRTTMACARWMLEIADPQSTAGSATIERGMRDSLDTLERLGFVLDHARGTASLALLLDRHGRTDEAAQLRASCKSTLVGIGALGLVEELGL